MSTMALHAPVVVAFPPVGETFWSGIGPVGFLRYRDKRSSKTTIVVRVVSPFPRDNETLLPGRPFAAWTECPEPIEFDPIRSRELVPFKASCDVGFIGQLPWNRDSAFDVHIGSESRTVMLTQNGATIGQYAEVPLEPRHFDPIDESRRFDRDNEPDRFQNAHPALRFPYPACGNRIAITSDAFSLNGTLGFDVFLRVDYLDDTVALPPAICDGILFDFDRRVIEWTFRAIISDPSDGREIERIVIAAFAPNQDEERSRIDMWLPHALFAHAAETADVRLGKHAPPLEEAQLAMARFSTWDLGPCAATLPIEEVAQIQVEMLRNPNRAAVLDAHGISDYQWSIEERAAMERLAELAPESLTDDDGDTPEISSNGASCENADDAIRYQNAYFEALGNTPTQTRPWDIADYAEFRAALEVKNPVQVLTQRGLSPGELINLDQVMESHFEMNEGDHQRFEVLFEEALVRLRAETNNDENVELDNDEEDS